MTIEEQEPENFNNAHKADFKSIYNQPDPRAYFAALTPLGYQIPQRALPVIDRVLALSSVTHDATITTITTDDNVKPGIIKVLDVCCSYGINAALLRHDLDLDGLAAHYASTPKLSAAEQTAADKRFFASRPRRPWVEVLGLDSAPGAVSYAVETGLLTAGFAEDLEVSEPSPALRAALRDVSVVVCRGGVGYVSATTFARAAACVRDAGRRLWVLSFVLRVFLFEGVAARLAEEHGLVTERVEGAVFRQRRFVSGEERRAAMEDVRRRGLDGGGLEADGWFWAECWVTRPRGAEARMEDVLGSVGVLRV
ncbi:Putative S-adenosyl-L-methionine-dependent methyltransferase superfamily [Colletotrichum destructivum]|uniref:S-adenosyl-L-methionine-dependent methyltransferase superfamily n=1 Tax=Colletotrichum destructivum TaxID=34406 RepID=A0AAX4ITN0_9PEZI|nr:Putative S-adenosyl-L-methionine-dependent methyltransferase superfamily [Colletotrichum destructivum]